MLLLSMVFYAKILLARFGKAINKREIVRGITSLLVKVTNIEHG